MTHFTPDKIGEALSSSHQHYLVAEVDDHIVGLAVLDWTGICPATNVPMPALQKLYVQEHFAGKGIGSLLLEKSKELCRELDFSKLWLTVHPQNVKAVNFYLKHGFVHAGTTNFVLEDELHENSVLHTETN